MANLSDKPLSQKLQAEINYRLLRIAGDHYGRSPQELDDTQLKRVRGIAINELELERLVLSSQEASQVVVDDQHISASLEEIRQRHDNADEYQQALARNQLDEEQIRESLARELRVQAVLDLVASRVPEIEDTEITLYYYLHPEKFNKPELRSARHILITINDDFAENQSEAARERLAGVAQRLRKQPNRFEEQALKHSECPTSLNGGSLGDVPQGTLYPVLDDLLFQMKPGDLSDPVQSEIGWHLLQCDAIQPAETLSFEQVKDDIRDQLQNRQIKKAQKNWIKARVQASHTAS